MLTSKFKDILQKENVVAGISLLIDPPNFAIALESNFPNLNIESINLCYLRYKPFRKCLAKYQLEINGNTVDLYAKAYSQNKTIKSFPSSDLEKPTRGEFHGKIPLPDYGIIVSVFPYDSELQSLKFFYKKKNQKKLLKELLPNYSNLWEGNLETISYKPERRYIGVIKTKNEPKAIFKIYSKNRYQIVKRKTILLSKLNDKSIPKFLGRIDSENVLAFSWHDGKPFNQVIIEDSSKGLEYCEKIGKTLVNFHSNYLEELDSYSYEDESLNLYKTADLFGFLNQDCSLKSKTIANFLVDHLKKISLLNQPIHGDFNTTNVVVNDSFVGFIDLDQVIIGDARLDLGSFIAYLELHFLLGEISKSSLEKLKMKFISGYCTTKNSGTLSNLEFFIALSLFKHVLDPFRNYLPDWASKGNLILNRVEEILATNFSEDYKVLEQNLPLDDNEKVTIPSTPPKIIKRDPGLPFLFDCLNQQKMELYFKRIFNELYKTDIKPNLKPIRKIRYKPGKRCLVEYDIEFLEKNKIKKVTLIGKIRRSGLDWFSYNLHEILWKKGFNSESLDNISVPKPMGIIPKLAMWLQQKEKGIPSIIILQKETGTKTAKKIAESLYKLHKTEVFTSKRHSIQEELQILNERLEEFKDKNPFFKKRVDKVQKDCEKLAQLLPNNKDVGIHRDFYHDQVLINSKGIVLVDFDLYCMGDPALDVGNFIGHLEEFSLRKFGDPGFLHEKIHAIKKRYVQLSKISELSITIYSILTLARHISISQQFPDRSKYTEKILSLCEQKAEKLLEQLKN